MSFFFSLLFSTFFRSRFLGPSRTTVKKKRMSADGLVTIDSQPRVNSEMLEKQVGHVVLLIGSFKNWEGSRLTVQAAVSRYSCVLPKQVSPLVHPLPQYLTDFVLS